MADLQLRAPGTTYEKVKIKYRIERDATYTPDFRLPNGIIVETKGRFLATDRTKHLLVKAQHPEYDIRFVFEYPNAKITKGSKTTYADWCDKHGFLWAKKVVPDSWIKETPRAAHG